MIYSFEQIIYRESCDMTFLRSIRNLNSSTELQVKSATSSDPLGPYNNDLVQLSMLTYNSKSLSIIESVLEKQLRKYSPSSIASSKFSNNEKGWLILLKSLTVVMYLLQNGSPEFVYWLKSCTASVIAPLHRAKLHSNTTMYKDAIKFKIDSIYKFCTNDNELQKLRTNIHVYREDMSIPGVKRANTTSAADNSSRRLKPIKRSRTVEIPRTVTAPSWNPDKVPSPRNHLQTISENRSENSVDRTMFT
ncbi:hypothetical protein PGUG_02243 [Meyerozyma guilliermondii ATCC 6260]|uniref:ENTH domain-containing protein n=1 Tax=Meyerozyma guilliermondii (strain ATCC 6260 / CBS 566 / DSM 6381 / JCM 1539 / NBRC 10279 / NRRL Y-324) TaxID=294746 RepID=A5DG42_PICGU|nr:uncharacterized protein PGUG_02243 [Meyerozyma guilliermondii ATCC 6260]EDK38145.2 hypothetical protein PGUG_02243 [Meyerozyma guilliermondii ATCC 6260]